MNLRDWGGKKHLMNKEGAGISDVWRDFFPVIKRIQDKSRPDIRLKLVESTRQSFSFEANDIAKPILDRLTNLVRRRGRKLAGIRVGGLIVPKQTESRTSSSEPRFVSPPLSAINKVELGDAIQVMEKLVKQYPQGVFDLVFADPPYNLQKDYKLYDDDLQAEEYLSWCDKWLELCVRLTKPKGNLFVLNIPKWAVFHAQTLMKSSYFQNWIVWDALSTPKGKIMPAHYALLHFAKSSARFTYNRPEAVDASEYCLRSSCLRSRKKALTSAFTESASIFGKTVQVSDIWWDIPRIKHRKHRDDHPCQLPDKLMDRIIQCFSNTNDLVFDPFAGAGTTALRALANGRSFFTIELDPSYHKITSTKLAQLETRGSITRQPSTHRLKSKYTKKDLELKVQSLAHSLGRAPSMQELLAEYQLELSLIESLYGDPKRVLKAARISLLNGRTN